MLVLLTGKLKIPRQAFNLLLLHSVLLRRGFRSLSQAFELSDSRKRGIKQAFLGVFKLDFETFAVGHQVGNVGGAPLEFVFQGGDVGEERDFGIAL